MPAFATPGCGHLGRAEALGHLRQAWSLSGVGIPGKPLLHHGSLDRVKTHTAGIPRTVRSEERAVGRSGPRPQLATAELGWASPSHALGHQGPLVRSHGRAALSKQVIMRIITHRPLDQLNPTAVWGECVDSEHLMHVMVGEAIGGGDQHPFHGGQRSPIPEAIQTGTLERGTAVAVITIEGLVGHRPIGGCRTVIASRTALPFNRLVLLLTSRCNPGVESDCHGMPPDDAMEQDGCLLHGP
jgi:hypothetical protein